MDPVLIAYIGIGLMFLLIVLRVPVGVSMAAIGVLGFSMMASRNAAFSLLSTECSSAISNADLAVIPLFILMGNFAAVGGLSTELYNVANAFLGHRRGGLALSTIGGCSFFGAICGSSPATAATFGRVALPEMLKYKYSPSFASGTIAAGGTLGSLIPPSVIMIIYAVMAEEFIITMFIAAVLPAVMEILFDFFTIMIYVRMRPDAGPPGPRVSWSQRFRVLKSCWRSVTIGVAVIGGIYGGVFTVNEAAAVGVVLSFGFVIASGTLTKENFWEALLGTATTSAMVYLVIIGANVFSYFMSLSQMPQQLVGVVTHLQVPNLVILFVLIVVYLILGSVFDTLAAMLVTLPFVLPVITSMGYSPVWWGIVNVVIIEAGMITPPIGLNVFVLQGVTRLPLDVIYRGTLPFVFAHISRIFLLILFPVIVTWLPNVLR
jgi:C4-dicarboxylate transporter, DctM subunit